MAKKAGSEIGDSAPTQSSSRKGVVDLADARVRLSTRASQPRQKLMEELDEIRSLLDQGLSAEAKNRLASLIAVARNSPSILALARCALSTALEMQGQYHESLTAVAMYESPQSKEKLDQQAIQSLKVQLSRILGPFTRRSREFIAALVNTRSRLIMRKGPWSIFVSQANGAASPK